MTRSRRKPAADRYAARKIRQRLEAAWRQQRDADARARDEHWRTHIAPNLDAWCEIVDTRNPSRPGAPDAP